MQRLQIDFGSVKNRSGWAGWVLLAAAIAVLSDLGVSYYQTRNAVAENEARLAALLRPGRLAHAGNGVGRMPAASSVAPEELAHAADSFQRLATPWKNLFSALESTATDKVALLAVEPDPKTGTVMISGESKDYLAALNYVLGLSQAKTLSNVRLVKHEVRQNNPQRPVGFSISASWKDEK